MKQSQNKTTDKPRYLGTCVDGATGKLTTAVAFTCANCGTVSAGILQKVWPCSRCHMLVEMPRLVRVK